MYLKRGISNLLDSAEVQNLADLNSSLGMQFRTCEKFWESTDSSLVLSQNFSQIQKPYCKYFDFDSRCESPAKRTQIAESNADSAESQNLSENQVKKSLSKFLLLFAFAKSRVPFNFIDFNLSNKVDLQNLVKNNPSLRDSAKQNRGNPPIKKTQNLQGGLPRRFCESARNDNFLVSSLHKCSAQNDKVGIYDYNFGVRVAESSTLSPKYALKG